MRIKTLDGKEERQILLGLVVSDQVLTRIADKYEKDLFRNKWANLVAGWCVKFYQNYRKAPGKQIEGIFTRWAEKNEDKTTIELVELFLDSLSKEYDGAEINAEYLTDRAAEYFNKVKLRKTLQDSLDLLDSGQYDDAETKVGSYGRIEMGIEAGCKPLNETNCYRVANSEENEALITYPGPLGNFFGNRLSRDNFIVFQAPEKGKKSFWLLDIVYRGLMERNKVLYLTVKDMSQKQVLDRWQARMTGYPTDLDDLRLGTYKYPRRMKRVKGDTSPTVIHKRVRTNGPLDESKVFKAQKLFRDTHLRSDRTFFHMRCLDSLSVGEIETIICRLRDYEGFVPDILVLDYIDVLDPPKHVKDFRHQVNHIWGDLSSLRLKYHCLLVSATQGDANSYNTVQTRSNFSEDKRKLGHVSGMIGLNQMQKDEKYQLMNLNWIAMRGVRPRSVWTAGCLSLSNPAIIST